MRENCSRTFHILCRFTGNFIIHVWTCQLLSEVPIRTETYTITKSLSGHASTADIRTKNFKNTFRSVAAWTNL